MSVILTKVGATRRTAKAYFGPEDNPGEPLVFVYDPSRLTPVKEQEIYNSNGIATAYATRICAVVREWDAVDFSPEDAAKIEAGELVPSAAKLVPFPPTQDNIFRMPKEALIRIVEAMNEDQRPSPEVSGNSSGSFGTEEK